MKTPCSANIVGEKSIKFFLDKKLIDRGSIIKVRNVPHAQCVIIE